MSFIVRLFVDYEENTMSAWVEQFFQASSASNGDVIRRAKSDVEQYSSLQEVVDEAEKHGFHVVETGDQIVVLCHQGTLHIHS